MSLPIAECTARVISEPWNEETTSNANMWQLAEVWKKYEREGKLRADSDGLEFEGLRIAYTDIDDAVLTELQGITSGYFLRIRVNGKPYQFGIMKGGSHFSANLPFAVRRVCVKGFTWGKALLRVLIMIALLAFVLWMKRH